MSLLDFIESASEELDFDDVVYYSSNADNELIEFIWDKWSVFDECTLKYSYVEKINNLPQVDLDRDAFIEKCRSNHEEVDIAFCNELFNRLQMLLYGKIDIFHYDHVVSLNKGENMDKCTECDMPIDYQVNNLNRIFENITV
jgi:hypothetical protein